MAFKPAGTLDEADAFEAKRLPDFGGGSIAFEDEVEDGVGVILDKMSGRGW